MSPRSSADVDGQDLFEKASRVGYFAKGVLYLLLGVISVRLAMGDTGGDAASQSGALRDLATRPFGEVALWFLVAGLAFHGLWRLTRVVRSPEDSDGGMVDQVKRVGYAIVALIYVGLAIQAFQVVTSDTASSAGRNAGSGSGTSSSEAAASTLIDSGLGQVIVLGVALALVVVGARFAITGVTGAFMEEELELGGVGDERQRLLRWSGTAGHLGRGLSFVIIAGFLGDAVIGYEPNNAVGLDGALSQLAESGFGVVLLVLVAIGFLAYGVFAIVAAPDKTVDEGV